MKKRRRKFLRRLIKGRRGQSMVSYAVISAFLLGTLFVMSMVILPRMLDAYNNFTQSLYFGINMPFP
jgi:hypothetical protein